MRHVADARPSSPTRCPRAPAHLDEVLARAKAQDEAVAALRVETYAGEADPYKKPRELDEATSDDLDEDLKAADEDELDGLMSASPGLVVVDKPGGHDVARRRRPGTPTGRHPQGRPRRHARPDGDRRAGARRQPRHPAARPPDADREGVRRHDPARRRPRPPTTPRARSSRPPRPTASPRRRSASALAAFVGEIDQVPTAVVGDQGRRQARLPARARRRGGRAQGPAGHRPRARPCTDVRGPRRSTSRCAAPAAPTSARSPATSAPRSGSAGT